jgi:hypothetical protein
MGKSTGFRFAGDGPGMQKKNKLAKKYGQGKNVPARGKMDDLDWGVEQAPVSEMKHNKPARMLRRPLRPGSDPRFIQSHKAQL